MLNPKKREALTAKKILDLYKEGRRDFSGIICQNDSFDNFDLKGIIFKKADLSYCRFYGTNLEGADFTWTLFFNTNLYGGAELTGAITATVATDPSQITAEGMSKLAEKL